MRATLFLTVLLRLASPNPSLADPHPPKYTTLIVEYAGEMTRYVPPVVISISKEEGEWYRQHLLPKPHHFIVHVQIVPASILDEITALPLLKRELDVAKPVDDKPKTRRSVSFTAGTGHHHAQIMVDEQTSSKILKSTGRVVAEYPTLMDELQEIDQQVGP